MVETILSFKGTIRLHKDKEEIRLLISKGFIFLKTTNSKILSLTNNRSKRQTISIVVDKEAFMSKE